MGKVLSEFFTNVAVTLFAAGAVAPLFARPKGLEMTWPYFVASMGTIIALALAGYFENKRK